MLMGWGFMRKRWRGLLNWSEPGVKELYVSYGGSCNAVLGAGGFVLHLQVMGPTR
jgi:hypothetical protein